MPLRYRALLLGAALVLASQAALVHPLEHADAGGRLVHLAGSPAGGAANDPGGDLCTAFAALGCAIANAGAALQGAVSISALRAARPAAPRARPAPPFRAQAPPAAA